MDFKNIRFYINEKSSISYSILKMFSVFCKNDINNLHYDLFHDELPKSDILLIINRDCLLDVYKNKKDKLLQFLTFNKMLCIDDYDNENALRQFNLNDLENFHSITEDPLSSNNIFIPSSFLTNYDEHGIILSNNLGFNRKPTFFSLMSKSRPHRDLLVKSLFKKEIISKGKVVYHNCKDNKIIPLLHKQELFSDLNNFNLPNHNWPDGQIGPDYSDYSLELVAETSVDFIFPTEKITRPLSVGMPFLVIAAPKFIQHLHSLGFETYGKFINEEYDNEPDLHKRIDLVTNILQSTFRKDIVNMYHKSYDIRMHNLENLNKLKSTYNFIAFEAIYNWIKNL